MIIWVFFVELMQIMTDVIISAGHEQIPRVWNYDDGRPWISFY